MATEHVVRPGDYLAKIAREYGFTDYMTIWQAAENAALRAKRKSPNVLLVGDVVAIPERKPREEQRATAQRHRFQTSAHELVLRIALEDAHRDPVADTDCELSVGGKTEKLRTDANGEVEQRIEPDTERAGLSLAGADSALAGAPLQLSVGHLPPVDAVAGQAARLTNLGYLRAQVADASEPRFLSALQEFQCDHGLGVDGKCGPVTQRKLEDVHGS